MNAPETPAEPPENPVESPVEALLADAAALPEIADLLPRSVRALVKDLGLPLAMRLVLACGGTTVYVPAPDPETLRAHPLVEVLGYRHLEALARVRGRETIQVARCAAARRALVQRQIAAEAAAGVPISELASRWDCSERTIHRRLRGGPRSRP